MGAGQVQVECRSDLDWVRAVAEKKDHPVAAPLDLMRLLGVERSTDGPDLADQHITQSIAPMLRELRACMHLPEDHPRRVAAIREKERLLRAIEARGTRP
jgi:hypothetical protein